MRELSVDNAERMAPSPNTGKPSRLIRWFNWLLSAAVLGAVVVVAVNASEEKAFLRLLEQAEPWWILVAFALQSITYFFQGEVFRVVGRAAGSPIGLGVVYKLSLAKLFIDQAIPSTGLSGTYVFANGLHGRGVPRTVVMSGVVVDLVSYYAAYVLFLAAAMVYAIRAEHPQPFVLGIALVFMLYAIALSNALLRLSGQQVPHLPKRIAEWKWLRFLLAYPKGASPKITHRPGVLGQALLCQVGIMLVDASTMWILVRALGHDASFPGVFASFMIANLFRTFGIVPGGLGVFEAGSVLTLKLAGVPVAVGLSATLLFRGLSFWLPMIPGLLFAREARKRLAQMPKAQADEAYWAMPPEKLLRHLKSSMDGLTTEQAARRAFLEGPNALHGHQGLTRFSVVLDQVRNPLLLVLFFAAVVSAFTGEWIDGGIVVLVLAASVLIGFIREYRSRTAAEALRSRIATRTSVLRDGRTVEIPASSLVPGDVVLLSAGSLIPADGVVLEGNDLFVSESMLTGESFPVQKSATPSAATAILGQRGNALHLGASVRSGSGRMLVVRIGARTEYGEIAHRLDLKPKPTAFERGITRFGYTLTVAMLTLVAVVFAVHLASGRPLIETLLFAIALAVGLSPELLPAILSVNLSRGSQILAGKGVLVRRLNAIENLGSMDVLCTDKTGTLTEGVLRLEGAFTPEGDPSAEVLEDAALNATLAKGFDNPLDRSIVEAHQPDTQGLAVLGEVPFDFQRKRLSVAVKSGTDARLIMKGAFHHVLEVCTRMADGTPMDDKARAQLESRYAAWSTTGTRVLAIAVRDLRPDDTIGRELEHDLAFKGFLTFLDRPKAGVADAIVGLGMLGVRVKLISGDNKLVSTHVAGLVGLDAAKSITGSELLAMNAAALRDAVQRCDLFAEVDPDQKEAIIGALRSSGSVVGFLGDGVNDAPAMHAADVGLSVDSAVDVAREAADMVLLERDLEVIRNGIEEGRRTFANTIKYILTTMSANLGNMLSMAVASFFLPFLPLLAGQILLNNFLSDIPAVGLADDNVDPEEVQKPRRWDMRFIVRFMLEFGTLSSVFDLLTFAVLITVWNAPPELFRTGWFMESLLTELVIALVVRTRRPFFLSRPGRLLLNSSIVLVVLALLIPYLPGAEVMGFVPLPLALIAVLVAIVLLYVMATELLKHSFYRKRG